MLRMQEWEEFKRGAKPDELWLVRFESPAPLSDWCWALMLRCCARRTVYDKIFAAVAKWSTKVCPRTTQLSLMLA